MGNNGLRDADTGAHRRHTEGQVLQQLERELCPLERRVSQWHETDVELCEILKGGLGAPRPSLYIEAF